MRHVKPFGCQCTIVRIAMQKAKDVMTRDVITLSPHTTAMEAIRILLDNRISGAPVVDSSGRLAGVLSEYQLLAVVYDSNILHSPVSELMTKDVISVDEETTLVDLAQSLVSLRIRRIPVINDGKLVGIVSRRDLLRAVVEDPVIAAATSMVGGNA